MKRFKVLMVLTLCLSLTGLMGCQKGEMVNKTLILATTTSTENSGLLSEILPVFEEETGIEVSVISVGTGAALQMGRDGEADVLIVHAKSSEEEFVSEGHGLKRSDVMYNDFVIVGPKGDPAGLKAFGSDVVEALISLQEKQIVFISRGDDSGTHKKELSLWESAATTPEGDWYVSSGQGMGAALTMANEMQGYTMTDRATYLSMTENLDLEIMVEGNGLLFNQYGVIAVNPEKSDKINSEAADMFVEWILSDEAQKLIGEFGMEKFGQSLFIPNAE